MKKGIFYNFPKASCSIYESGVMCYNALKLSESYELIYTEQQSPMQGDFDFAIFNHHPWTNGWMIPILHTFTYSKYTIVTEVGDYSNILPYTPHIFDKYIILDPTIPDFDNIYGFPRPLELITPISSSPKGITIGSFGFPTDGKNWEEIVMRTQKEFDNAVIRFNIPHATFIPDNEKRIQQITQSCNSLVYKPNVELQITHHYFNKEELVQWCAENTLNVFLYNRNQPGLSATTDQAIIAERPIYVSTNTTFRHIHQYLNPYPQTFKEAIEHTLPSVLEMKRNWSPYMFAQKFEQILLSEQ
jgi:hypothetical protein